MGLDSYVRHVVTISGFDAGAVLIGEVADVVGVPYDADRLTFSGHATVTIPFLYWRKDWAIHTWFIDHIYEGQDHENDVEFGIEELQNFHDDLYTALTYPDTEDQLFDPTYWATPEAAPFLFESRRATLAIVAEELKRAKAIAADASRPHSYSTYEYHGSW